VERQAYRASGLQLSTADERLADEMLLFYQLVTRPQQGLVLSYSAVDSNGQELLPSTFLTAVRDCFEPEAVAVERRVMLLDGLRGDRPLCPPEQRVRVALQAENATFQGLPARLADRLVAAQVVASQRFARREHGIYDGRLRQPELVGDLGERFGPQHVFSPTALEEYIACPFRFFLNHVLRLEPLEEPAETIEGADRGLVMHRALSRLHNYLHDSGIDRPDESVNSLLRERLDGAIAESAHHSSAAATVLWDLEGQRLRKRATRYQEHWKRFIDDYRDQALRPVPLHFEKSFGLDSGAEAVGPLVIRADGIEVRVGGRIDRVDVAKHADGWYFWIIDYKTGRSGYYSPAGIKAFEKLQLTLYALAAERLLFSEEQARPLGLAYWLVIDSGAKVVLPGKGRTDAWFAQASPWEAVRADLEALVARLARHIRQGDFPLGPRSVDCTATCDFGQMCRISQARAVDKPWSLELPVIQ
jgi:ATP-dependent helicase/nuclease subunit B